MTAPRVNAVKRWIVLLALVTASAAGLYFLFASTIHATSASFDENIYAPAGYSYLKTGDFRLNLEHPPFSKVLYGATMLTAEIPADFSSEAWRTADQVRFGLDLFSRGNWTLGLAAVRDARSVAQYVSLWVLLLVGGLAQRRFGLPAAIIAAGVLILTPDFLAYGALATPDIVVTLFMFVAVVSGLKFVEEPDWGGGLLVAFFTGLALLSKHTALLLFPYFAIVGTVMLWKRRPSLVKVAAGAMVFILLVGLVVWAGYFFHGQPELRERFDLPSLPLPAAYLAGFKISGDLISHRLTYFLGAPHPDHPRMFFPVSFLLKTPIPLLILFFLSLRLVPLRTSWPYWLFCLLLFLSAVASPFPFGQRYLLPMVPFMALLAGASGAKLIEKPWDRVFLGALSAWLAWGTLSNHPHHLAYFNEFAGDRDKAYRLFVDSNLDWGTELPALQSWMLERRGASHIFLSYFGTTDPAGYMPLFYTPLPSYHQDLYYPERIQSPVTVPDKALLAVSATNLAGLYQPRYFDEVVDLDHPVAVLGRAIFIFKARGSWTFTHHPGRTPAWSVEPVRSVETAKAFPSVPSPRPSGEAAESNAAPHRVRAAGARPLAERIAPPSGFHRVALVDGSFGAFLRSLAVKEGEPPVLLFNGARKNRQDVHAAVFDIDTGTRDLQQCADAVIRLRAEYLWASGRKDGIMFRFTSGDEAAWAQWSDGWRPSVDGSRVRWSRTAGPDASYASFRKYLDKVFEYAGSHSLSGELRPVAPGEAPRPGDVLVQGGFPGHAVILVDAAERPEGGGRVYLLAQSYMPAQEIHVLKNFVEPSLSPWFRLPGAGVIETPEWTFRRDDLKRFPE